MHALDCRPKVLEAVPDARLDVYYGFWPYAMWNEQEHLIKLRQYVPSMASPG